MERHHERTLREIQQYIQQHRISPTIDEIARLCGVSKTAAYVRVQKLLALGKISYTPKIPRSIVVVEESPHE